MTAATKVTERKEVNTNPPKDSAYWVLELHAAHEREKQWREERAPAVVKRYRDEREANASSRKVNILWANTEVLKASLYPASANPDVRRRFGTSDKVGRNAAIALERSLSYCADAYGFDCAINAALEDSLLPGRGVCWEVYEPTIGQDDAGKEKITGQETRTEWVYWEDYREGQARSWDKMPWVARRHLWTKKQVEDADLDVKDGIAFNHSTAPATIQDEQEVLKRAEIWEIWDKVERQRVYVSEGCDKLLKVTPDPYKLKGFFPCAEPLKAVESTKNRIPIPHFTQYQDQADELDRLTDRLFRLTAFIKWAGAYDSAEGANAELKKLATADDGDWIPVKNWSQLSEKGGLPGVFQAIDIQVLAEVVERLEARRAILIQTIYEVTGISDIIRGATDPRETKGAQTLKAQFGSMRMQKMQKEVQRFVRDVMRIKSEIIAEHFSQEKIAEISQLNLPTKAELMMQQQAMAMQAQQAAAMAQQQPPGMPGQAQPPMPQPQAPAPEQQAQGPAEGNEPPVTWDDVMAVLRNDDRRAYKVDVETDQTVFQNAEEEKKSRIEFMEAFGAVMEKTMAALQVNPALLPLMRETVMFTIRAFKVGRVLEEAVEDTFAQLAQQLKEPRPNPEEQKLKAELEKMRTELMVKIKGLEADLRKQAAELNMKREEHAMDMQFKREENAMDMQARQQEQAVDMFVKTQGAQLDMETKRATADQTLELNEQKAQQQAALAAQKARQKPAPRPNA